MTTCNIINNKIQTPWFCMVLIAIATVAAFFPTFSNELMTGWDDQWQVTNHFTERGFAWDNLLQIFTEPYGTQYSPLNQYMYILLYTIGGYNPIYYHAASLLLHIANACLIYIIIKRLLLTLTSTPAVQVAWIAFLTTLLFALHPMQVESVAWVSASKVVLYSTFFLLATWSFMNFLTHIDHNNFRAWAYYALILFFFLCAYGSKEQAVILPVWLTVLCLFYKKDFRKWKVYSWLVPLFILSVVLGLLFIYGISARAALREGASLLEYSWWQRIVFSCYALTEYLCKWFVPYRLVHLYIFPMSVGEPLPSWMLVYPLILSVAVFSLWRYLRHWVVVTGGVFFLINIVLVLHVFPISRPNLVADRYIYLAGVGISFITAYFLVKVWLLLRTRNRKIVAIAVFSLFLVLGLCTYSRTQYWRDTDTIKGELKELTSYQRGDEIKK